MKNTKGSKSVPTEKAPKSPAPEVTIENGTTVVLPAPADAPAPAKGGRKKKQPIVATAAAEVPDWAKRAAGRDTAAEMATVPDAAPVPEPAPESPKARKGRVPRAAKPAPTKAIPKEAPATPGSLRAIGDGWLDSLRAAGHSPSTVSSYGNDLAIAYDHLGADTAASSISEKQIAAFNASKGVVKTRTGKAKAQPTILKTRRALRLALVWAEQKGLIKKAPFPAKTPA
jgi:hypothetical protein